MILLPVYSTRAFRPERFRTMLASILTLLRMCPQMANKIRLSCKASKTVFALIWPFASMNAHVRDEAPFLCKAFLTFFALEWPFSCVNAHVRDQKRLAGKKSLTCLTLILGFCRVSSLAAGGPALIQQTFLAFLTSLPSPSGDEVFPADFAFPG